ncbi:hypothetical protein [Granulicella arctica]|uniref:hypothetical protein n=1 Tax=Granulicella arctica TaxID=940613 RepID=UPI0021DFBE3E|nr:hypothetical protein [Granulicella arctica]
MTLAERLLPELEQQLANTHKVLDEVPDGRNEFTPHEKSMPLTRLAGHTAELAGFVMRNPDIVSADELLNLMVAAQARSALLNPRELPR